MRAIFAGLYWWLTTMHGSPTSLHAACGVWVSTRTLQLLRGPCVPARCSFSISAWSAPWTPRLTSGSRRLGRSSSRVPRTPHRALSRVVVVLAVAVPMLTVSSQMVVGLAAQLPDVSGLANDLPADTVIYASDNRQLADLHPRGYQHYYEPLSGMGGYMPDAVVAVEDRNFYQEPGVDPSGIARAAFVELKAGNGAEGASTITQQLVKVRLLGPDPTIQRKATEALLSFAVEHRYSKSQILEMYLNSVSFGNSAVGAEAASQIYFKKKTSELDLAQASMLAGLIRGPSLYNPFHS